MMENFCVDNTTQHTTHNTHTTHHTPHTRKTSAINVRIEDDLKEQFREKTAREGRDQSELVRSFVISYLEAPEQTKEPIRVTLVNSHPLLTHKISGRTGVLLDSVERAKKLLNTIGIVTRELKREIRNETKKMAVSPELAADIEALLKAPEAKK